jgi:uncharacterized hydrophobic protein (TIGR00271 family)
LGCTAREFALDAGFARFVNAAKKGSRPWRVIPANGPWPENLPVLHVRVASPPEVTGPLVDALIADPGVRNLVVLAGAARQPDGDAVQFDVHTGSANLVFQRLRELRLDGRGSIMVEAVDAALTDAGRPATRRGPFQPEAAPVWEMVEAAIRAGGAYAPSFFGLLVIAGLIACVGILTNSQILVVGAMVVGPEYQAIIAIALGMERRWPGPVRRGALALLTGFALAIAIAVVFGLIIRGSGHTPEGYLNGVRPVSALIDEPNFFSVIVAVLAGIVGVVSLTESRANALIGVFISVTTIPAAAALGLALAYQDWRSAAGSAVQLVLNVGLLIAVGAGTFRLQRLIWRRAGPELWAASRGEGGENSCWLIRRRNT